MAYPISESSSPLLPVANQKILSAEEVIRNIRAQIEASLWESLASRADPVINQFGLVADAATDLLFTSTDALVDFKTDYSHVDEANRSSGLSHSEDSGYSTASGNALVLASREPEPVDPEVLDQHRYESDAIDPPPLSGELPHRHNHHNSAAAFSDFELF